MDMKLIDYLRSNRISNEEFGLKIGASAAAVRKWRYGERIPRPEQMARITAETNGDVRAQDFYTASEAAA
ncbi:hypothetical protein LB518_22945 [Mesorhizobium sp. BR1-1-16]|uniref:hypothetical protein n=1 Tax=Mesorhizobium sp. BR1-1-16 TaxID=2876653 RepID=UPI001CCB6697|nr:hypothetical protein [Mesorhizobium sp. BR1-1-16]MBZ9939173.1 hypothetical protein [Mesorhizobium sp. BR1-1-16]